MTVSDNNIIYENDINNNSETGISLWGNDCDNNKIYSNDIFGSKIHQVLEGLGCINQWDNGTTGNYWGDYTQKYPDATNDEIVWNTPYEIDGQGPGIDYFPLVESIFHDFHAPEFLYFPENFTARKGYSNLTISWNATDLHPDTYIIELNGTKMVEATTWNNGTEIFYNIPDGLLEGIHNITIFISDESGNISFHTVLFIVNNNISGFPLFSIILFISVSVYLLKMKVDHRK
jgi:parallel beta-helix repeat protein